MKSFVWFRRLVTASLTVPFLLTAAPAAQAHGFGGGSSHGGFSGGGFSHGGVSHGGVSHGGFSHGGFSRGSPGFARSFGHDHAFNHGSDRDHRFDHDRDFDHRFGDRDHFFRHHDRFFFGFDFAAFGYPWWYPDYYYWYPSDYSDSYDTYYGPSYDPQYWTNLAFSVQTALARRGYYHGSIDGTIGSDSREAIRTFQAAQKLPVTGTIDPRLLNALGIRYRTA